MMLNGNHFAGFERPGQGSETVLVIPRSFFERVVLSEPASTIRIVAHILTRTLQGQTEVEASYTDFVRELRLSRQAIQEGLARAIEAGYIRQVQAGENGHVKSRYSLCWAQAQAHADETDPTSNRHPDSGSRESAIVDTPGSAPALVYLTTNQNGSRYHPQSENENQNYPAENQTGSRAEQQSENQTNSPLDSIHDSKSLPELDIESELESLQPGWKAAGQNADPASIAVISSYLTNLSRDFSRELGDIAHASANRSQTLNLWRQSHLPEQEFAGRMYQARDLTRRYAVLRPGETPPPPGQPRNRMPYFFTTLRDLLGLPAQSSLNRSNYSPTVAATPKPSSPPVRANPGYALADSGNLRPAPSPVVLEAEPDLEPFPTTATVWQSFRGAEALRRQQSAVGGATAATTHRTSAAR